MSLFGAHGKNGVVDSTTHHGQVGHGIGQGVDGYGAGRVRVSGNLVQVVADVAGKVSAKSEQGRSKLSAIGARRGCIVEKVTGKVREGTA